MGAGLVGPDLTTTLENLGTTLLEVGEQSVVNAAISTAIEGGSFLTAVKDNAVTDLAAVGAGAIGATSDSLSLQNVVEHGVLGCVASAAEGTGCAGGAIGGAASALIAPFLVQQAGGLANLTDEQRTSIVGISTLLGGLTAGLAGQNAAAGANAATNESLNNSTNPEDIAHGRDLMPLEGGVGGGTGIGGPGGTGEIFPDTPSAGVGGGPAEAVGGTSNASSNTNTGSGAGTTSQNAASNSSSPSLSSTPSPALPDSPYSPTNVESRVKPPYQTNPAHDTSSPLYNPAKTPEPTDAQSAYESGAVRGNMYTWYAQGQGGYYRYFSDNAGTVHFSGTVSPSKVPSSVLKLLGK
jgi:filamentous hemagglutinin